MTLNEKNNKRRRREKELEQQLLNGNLSALPEAAVQDLHVDREWDSTNYSDLQQREFLIHKEFGLINNKSLTQTTKIQNRRHQLSSLAMKAAQVELAMMDARGSRMKTKNETQSKYGW